MERQQSQQERSLAWFKLADLIARGEREKALSVFRLLSHSFHDKAYVLQIEGDILWFMDSAASVEKYKQAASLYQKEKRLVDAIAVQEHVLTLRPDAIEAVATLLILYALVDWEEKFIQRFALLLDFHRERRIDEAQVEKTLHALGEVLLAKEPKVWLKSWLNRSVEHLPPAIDAQLKTIIR